MIPGLFLKNDVSNMKSNGPMKTHKIPVGLSIYYFPKIRSLTLINNYNNNI